MLILYFFYFICYLQSNNKNIVFNDSPFSASLPSIPSLPGASSALPSLPSFPDAQQARSYREKWLKDVSSRSPEMRVKKVKNYFAELLKKVCHKFNKVRRCLLDCNLYICTVNLYVLTS